MPGRRGWILGHLVDGTQAEYVRVPFADLSVYPLPGALADEDAVLLADIFPTAYEVGVLNGRVRPGDTVVVVGAGPVGLAAIATAQLSAPNASSRWTWRRPGSRRRRSSAPTRWPTRARVPSSWSRTSPANSARTW
ncbi:hypothetical protein SALBM217S_07490 [Streptomyces griseoloalbus]